MKQAQFDLLMEEASKQVKQKYYSEADSTLRKALDIYPEDIHALNLIALNSLFEKGATDESLNYLKTAKNIAPRHPVILNSLGVFYRYRGDFVKASELFETAIEFDPNAVRAMYNLAVTYQENRQIEQSLRVFQAYLKLKPGKIDIICRIIYLLETLGNFEQALDLCNHHIQEFPHAPRLRFLRSRLSLKLGKYEQGWIDYEWRHGIAGWKDKNLQIRWDKPVWNGQRFDGKTLLVIQDQGFGVIY